MSIDDESKERIRLLIKDEQLFELESADRGWGQLRTMFVSQEVYEAVTPPFEENHDGQRLVEFRAALDEFVIGSKHSVAEDPFNKPSDAMVARVDPVEYEIWDIRCIAPDPGIRCLGSFAGQDTFVALIWAYREFFDEVSWREEIERCKVKWQELFGTIQPFKGRNLDEYFSDNYFPV